MKITPEQIDQIAEMISSEMNTALGIDWAHIKEMDPAKLEEIAKDYMAKLKPLAESKFVIALSNAFFQLAAVIPPAMLTPNIVITTLLYGLKIGKILGQQESLDLERLASLPDERS